MLKFILKSLWHYKRQHITVLIGTIISTAIITGALIVGDSVKYSLKSLVSARLGNIDIAMPSGDRYVRFNLASDIRKQLNINASSILASQGITINPDNKRRVNSTNIWGIDTTFWKVTGKTPVKLKNNEAIVSQNTAKKLNVRLNDHLLIRIRPSGFIPVNAPFSSEEEGTKAIRVKIAAIANDNQMARFSLRNNQSAPHNIFLSYKTLSRKLNLRGYANLIIANSSNKISTDSLNKRLNNIWQLKDAGLDLEQLPNKDEFEITSKRIFIDHSLTSKLNDKLTPDKKILSYLVNSIRKDNRSTPYSFVSSVSGYFESLQNNEIVINSWLANDIKAQKGDTLFLKYYVVGSLRNITEDSISLVVKDVLDISDSRFNKSLMPEFPGLSDAGNCRDWKAGVPVDFDKIRDKDDDYWKKHKGTPKAFISEETGLKLWSNRFGSYTSLRFNNNRGDINSQKKDILSSISPSDINLKFLSVKSESLRSASDSVSFSELFISLSFFVILASVILTSLLYSLHSENRSQETGILSAIGFTNKRILKFKLYETAITIIAGAAIGTLTGILYNFVIISAINSIWIDIVRTNQIIVHIDSLTLIYGAVSGALISVLSVYIVTKKKLKQTVNNIIRSNTIKKRQKRKGDVIFSITCLLLSVVLIVYAFVNTVDKSPGLFLLSGFLIIAGLISFINHLFKNKLKRLNISNNNLKYAINSLTHKKTKSIAIISLISLCTYLIVITGANRRTFHGVEDDRKSGTGGYDIWCETSIPLLHDLNTKSGKSKLGLEDNPLMDSCSFFQVLTLEGDDASCLNLNQVSKPGIAGINPEVLNSSEAFSFSTNISEKDRDIWLELNKNYDDVIPAIADQTVITWGLMKSVGDTLVYTNERGNLVKLKLIAGLSPSVFQGRILISESNFQKHFPSSGGSKLMLIDTPVDQTDTVKNILNKQLTDYGIELTSTNTRLAEFNSVTNTYLSIFMILGGLGLIIGTFGIGIVILRDMIDRKHELSILSAFGIRKNIVFKQIFVEYGTLVIISIFIALTGVSVGIMPSIFTSAFKVPVGFVSALIALILINSFIWIWITTRISIKSHSIKWLRIE